MAIKGRGQWWLVPLVCCVGLALAWSSFSHAASYQPTFRPDQLKGPPKGQPNEVLVLGTPHLSGLPDSFEPQMLEPLLQRLAEWQPTAIAIENLSGLQCDALRRQPQRYAETVQRYCVDTSAAEAATGLSVIAANDEAERLLAIWPEHPTAEQRRRLAALFLAAGEPASAVVQWLQLPEEARQASAELPQALVDELDLRSRRKNESYLVAAQLAARLGLQRCHSVDDHTADWAPANVEAFGAAIMAAWNNPATEARQAASEALEARLGEPGGLMAIYRAANAPTEAMQAYRSDFGATLVEPSAEGYGRMYLGGWETRNLRMVARIREVLARQPGTRLLAIVGSSHKGYYEAYLHMMHDVQLVSADVVLADPPAEPKSD